MNELSCSKYCILTVMSYIDYSHIVNREIMRKLNQRFRGYSLDKAEDGLNMLTKATVTFRLDSPANVKMLGKINLMHYKFGLYVHICHLKPLLTILKMY